MDLDETGRGIREPFIGTWTPSRWQGSQFTRKGFGGSRKKESKRKVDPYRIWHESQEIHTRDDGSIIFEAEVAGTEEIKFWIMNWGSKAEVLEPEALALLKD